MMYKALLIAAVVCVLVVCSSAQDADAPRQIPGSDFVGFGFDVRHDDARSGLTFPMFTWSYLKAKDYTYPTDATTTYTVPDQLLVMTVARTEAESFLFTSVVDMVDNIASQMGISSSNENSLSSSNGFCRNASDSSTCQTLNSNNQSTMFSLSSNVNHAASIFEEDSVYIVQNRQISKLYQVLLDTRFLVPGVKADLKKFSGVEFNADTYIQFFNFIRKYGTHFVISAVMGGQVSQQYIISKTVSGSSDSNFGNSSTGNIKNSSVATLSLSEAKQRANSQFQSSLSGQSNSYDSTTTTTDVTSNTASDFRIAGGDTSLLDLLDVSKTSDAINDWKTTIVANPVPVIFRLREVSSLFEDIYERTQMSTAVRAFLSTMPLEDFFGSTF